MNLQILIKKLRKAADSLEDLLIIQQNENGEVAEKILNRPKKLHWTQTPAGKKRMSREMKKKWKSGLFKGNVK